MKRLLRPHLLKRNVFSNCAILYLIIQRLHPTLHPSSYHKSRPRYNHRNVIFLELESPVILIRLVSSSFYRQLKFSWNQIKEDHPTKYCKHTYIHVKSETTTSFTGSPPVTTLWKLKKTIASQWSITILFCFVFNLRFHIASKLYNTRAQLTHSKWRCVCVCGGGGGGDISFSFPWLDEGHQN